MRCNRFYSVGFFGLALLFAGCGKTPPPPQELSASEAPAVVKGAFEKAAPEVKQAADELAGNLTAGNAVDSFNSFQQLSSRPDLTPEQRKTLGRSQITVMKRLQEAANQGDARAAEAYQTYQSNK